MSKSREARPSSRPVRIYASGHRGIIAVRRASSLKQALLEYAKETLIPQGFSQPKTTGNTLTINDKSGKTQQYVALELHQKHLVK